MRIFLAVLLSITLSSCTSVGLLVSPQREFTTTQTMQLRARPANFVDTVAQVGKSLGYNYSGVDRAKNKLKLTDHSTAGMGVLIGKISRLELTIWLSPNGRTVNFEIAAAGNYSTSNQDKIEARLQKLKDALRAKFR